MSLRESIKQILRMCGHAMSRTVHERLDSVEAALQEFSETHTALLQSNIHIVETLPQLKAELDQHKSAPQALKRDLWIEAPDYAAVNPEIGLMSFLYSYLPTRIAVDVGARSGEFSDRLLNTGYQVFAFEQSPLNFKSLMEKCGGRAGFHGFNVALGGASGEAPLHLAAEAAGHSLTSYSLTEGLWFSESIPVPVRTLADLHHDNILPEDVSLLKTATEGCDLEVIRGMGDRRYPVVSAEFRDARIPLKTHGERYELGDMVGEMRTRGYGWFIALYRVWGQNTLSFFANHEIPVAHSWGTAVFFRDRETFGHAHEWCSAVLPRTYFKPPNPPL